MSFPHVPPLSFPQVSSGNPVLFFCPFLRVVPDWEKTLDSRLKMSGMTEGGGGHDRGGDVGSSPVIPAIPRPSFPHVPPLSFPQGFSGNPVLFFCPFIRVSPDWGKSLGFPIKNVGNDRGRRRRA